MKFFPSCTCCGPTFSCTCSNLPTCAKALWRYECSATRVIPYTGAADCINTGVEPACYTIMVEILNWRPMYSINYPDPCYYDPLTEFKTYQVCGSDSYSCLPAFRGAANCGWITGSETYDGFFTGYLTYITTTDYGGPGWFYFISFTESAVGPTQFTGGYFGPISNDDITCDPDTLDFNVVFPAGSYHVICGDDYPSATINITKTFPNIKSCPQLNFTTLDIFYATISGTACSDGTYPLTWDILSNAWISGAIITNSGLAGPTACDSTYNLLLYCNGTASDIPGPYEFSLVLNGFCFLRCPICATAGTDEPDNPFVRVYPYPLWVFNSGSVFPTGCPPYPSIDIIITK